MMYDTSYFNVGEGKMVTPNRKELWMDPEMGDLFYYDGLYVSYTEETSAYLPFLSREFIEAKGFVYIGEV